ncbi:hypothetical protein [Streptomyces sp. NPDC051677]|uniref:hypothetical protein n=1 Tax=Streptomyces sp. NPDC051677 TaxID=3365669 RepID=UPI0037CE7753
MAFEYGLLGRSGGATPSEALNNLLEALGSGTPKVTHGEVKQGEGWASSRISFRGSDGSSTEQNIQVSVGGKIVDIFLRKARAVLADDLLTGRDLMLVISISGPMDVAVNDRVVGFAQQRWQGIPWDEISGFLTSFDRP